MWEEGLPRFMIQTPHIFSFFLSLDLIVVPTYCHPICLSWIQTMYRQSIDYDDSDTRLAQPHQLVARRSILFFLLSRPPTASSHPPQQPPYLDACNTHYLALSIEKSIQSIDIR